MLGGTVGGCGRIGGTAEAKRALEGWGPYGRHSGEVKGSAAGWRPDRWKIGALQQAMVVENHWSRWPTVPIFLAKNRRLGTTWHGS